MNISEKLVTIAENQEKVYEAGKKNSIKEWQDEFLTYHNAVGYHYAFSTWNEETYRLFLSQPNDKFWNNIAGADQMFRNFNYYGVERKAVDLVKLHKELGIPDINWSTAIASCYATFAYARVSHLGVVDLSRANHTQFFNNSTELVTIDEVKLNPSASYDNFGNCPKLANIKFGNNLVKSISFSSCPLTKASIENVIEHLDDNVTGYTVTFKKTAKESAYTTDEWNSLIATKPNWTFSLV